MTESSRLPNISMVEPVAETSLVDAGGGERCVSCSESVCRNCLFMSVTAAPVSMSMETGVVEVVCVLDRCAER